jgi:PqqD family protein of HPr-rel-A system
MTDLMSAVVRVPDHVVHRAFEAETLLLNLQSGQYHGLNQTGGRFLELIEESDGDPSAAVTKLAAEYDVEPNEIADDMRTFLTALAERGLVEVDGASTA